MSNIVTLAFKYPWCWIVEKNNFGVKVEEEEIRRGLGRQRFCSSILKGIVVVSKILLSIMLIELELG